MVRECQSLIRLASSGASDNAITYYCDQFNGHQLTLVWLRINDNLVLIASIVACRCSAQSSNLPAQPSCRGTTKSSSVVALLWTSGVTKAGARQCTLTSCTKQWRAKLRALRKGENQYSSFRQQQQMFGSGKWEKLEKLTEEISLKLWLQGQHLVEADKETEMNEQVGEDVRPLDSCFKRILVCRPVIVLVRRHDVFSVFCIFWFRSPKSGTDYK